MALSPKSPGDELPAIDWNIVIALAELALRPTNNLSDITDPAAARDNLGLGNSATRDVGTGPGDVAAGDDYRVAGVRAFGAVGDGVTDDTAAIQAAFSAVPDTGGEVIIPDGTYIFSSTLFIKANTTIEGKGTGRLKGAALAEWTGTTRAGLVNVNYEAGAITDENISIRNLTIDFTDVGLGDGRSHCLYLFRVRTVRVSGCTMIDGASSCALVGCEDTLEEGNRYLDFRNCGSDHWNNPINNRVVGCHMETSATAQMVNFNPEPSETGQTGYVADGFTMTGCTLIAYSASAEPCQIEPLETGNTVKNVTITGNIFKNTYIVVRGDVQGAVIAGNTFSDFQGITAAIYGSTQFGNAPSAMSIYGNTIRDPLTASPSEGVIVAASASAVITNNIIMGTAYTAVPIVGNGTTTQLIGNYVEKKAAVGRLQGGARLINGTDNYWGWTDASGTNPRMYCQTDSNWIWLATGSGGVDRFVATLQMRSSSSEMNWAVPFKWASYTRSTPATVAAAGTAITDATALTANINNVTTCTAGVADGVSLQAVDGQEQTVINSTAATLKVYPNNSGSAQIDAGGASIPVTIAAGKSKTFTRVAANDFRTIAVVP